MHPIPYSPEEIFRALNSNAHLGKGEGEGHVFDWLPAGSPCAIQGMGSNARQSKAKGWLLWLLLY